MNIFVLDRDIQKCAQYHADQHVSKMILESVQMLCTVLNQLGIRTPYRSTHTKHPCTLWVGTSLSNWVWLRELALALHQEYRYRFGKDKQHKSALVAKNLSEPPIVDHGISPFAQAMPDIYKVSGDAVQAYRNFYIGDKSRFASWTKREPPAWYLDGIKKHNKD
jgi:hypothetical protein